MRRLSVQLALAMVGSVLASLLIITGTQRVAEFRAYQLLPEEVRDFVPPPNLWPLWQRTRGGHQPGTGPGTGPGAVPGAGPGPGAGPSAGPSPAYEGPTQAVGAAGSDASDSNDDRLARNFLAIRDYQRESLLVGIVLASLVSVAFAWWLSRRIARPLEEVSKAATLVAGGDLAVRIPDSPALRRSSLETTRLAEDFNRMATALDSYEKERKAMIADIAHELRTPLTSMRLRLQALEDGLLPFEAREIASLNRSAELLSRLIEDLRTLSLADGGRLRLSMSNQDVTRIVRDTVDLQRPGFDQKGVYLQLNETAAPHMAAVDRDRITQVISNLLDNALRVTDEGGTVSVESSATATDLLITISDTGPGLSDASLAKAFDRYFQDDRDTRGGSGLGLAIVDALVKLHGGSVSASNTGTGARFTVKLPRTGATMRS